MNKKYTKTKHKGIWKNIKTNTYSARKTVCGKRKSKNFKSLREAIKWRATFNGTETNKNLYHNAENLNGTCSRSFQEVWKDYLRYKKDTLAYSSFQRLQRLGLSFDSILINLPINRIDNLAITNFINRLKSTSSIKRTSCTQELKVLSAFFNYIHEAIEFQFRNPINKLHRKIGTIKRKRDSLVKRKSLTSEELRVFISLLPEPIKAIAQTQFLIGARISEVMCLNIKNIDFENRTMKIKDVAVICGKTKKVIMIKELPKNGEVRVASIPSKLEEILKSFEIDDEGYFFREHSNFISYRTIQYQYNKALKLMGLNGEVSGTHFLRHTSATIVRNELSLEHTAALTGHKDIRMAQHYGKLKPSSKNEESAIVLETILEKKDCYRSYPELPVNVSN